MFDALRNMGALASLMKDLPRLKQRMAEVKDRLRDMQVTSESGGKAVRVVCDGLMNVKSVHVDPALLTSAHADPMITQAVNDAIAQSRALAEREFAAAAQELGLPIPPGGMGGLMS